MILVSSYDYVCYGAAAWINDIVLEMFSLGHATQVWPRAMMRVINLCLFYGLLL